MARTLLLCIGFCLVPVRVQAAEFYVDPVKGSPRGDGSAERPWRTIQEVLDAGPVESQQWDKLPYSKQSRSLAGRSSRGRFIFAEHSSHNIHLDVPDLVIEGILSLVNEARGTRPQQQVRP